MNPMYINRSGIVTKGTHEGKTGLVVGADWIKQVVYLQLGGEVIKVPWESVEQS